MTAAAAQLSAPRSGAGLVSVPTSRTTDLGLREAVQKGRASDLRQDLGAFQLDSDARRLASLRCAVGFAARAQAVIPRGGRASRAWMVTLTYRGDATAWRSDHMKTAVHRFRIWCNRQGFAARYVWVAELQQRGVIHYHLVIWLPHGIRCPKWDSRGWWPHGMTNRKTVRKSAVGYLMKYLSKGSDVATTSFPRGARIYGVGGLDRTMRRARRWLRLPSFVQANSSILDDWRPVVGGGWRAPDGGHWPSEFALVIVAGARCLARVCTHPRELLASGPFSWITDRDKALALV